MALPFLRNFMPIQQVAYGGYYTPIYNPFSIFGILNNRMQNPFVNNTFANNNPSIFNNNTQRDLKGKVLYQNALAGIPSEKPNPPMCARYVKNAIVNSGLGVYELGNGEQTKYMLRKNPNFREVAVKGEDLKNLPEGTVITYDAFDSAVDENGQLYNVGENGHVVIKGKGEYAISDRFEDFIIPSDNAHTFVLA